MGFVHILSVPCNIILHYSKNNNNTTRKYTPYINGLNMMLCHHSTYTMIIQDCMCYLMTMIIADCIALVIEEWIWSIGGMILTWKNWCTWRKSYPSATLSIIHPTWTGLELNPDLCNDRPTINSLSHSMTKCLKFPLEDVPLWNRTYTNSGTIYKTSYSYINFR